MVEVGGLDGRDGRQGRWALARLRTGDEVRVRVEVVEASDPWVSAPWPDAPVAEVPRGFEVFVNGDLLARATVLERPVVVAEVLVQRDEGEESVDVTLRPAMRSLVLGDEVLVRAL
jgi:hypothetical protein